MSAIKENVQNAAASISSHLKPSSPNQLILVTGASGFVAAHVLNSLLSRGYRVRGTVRNDQSAEKVKKSHSKYASLLSFAIVPDIAADGAFDAAVEGVDGVIHTASPFQMSVEDNKRDLLDPAIKGTNEILTAVQKHAPQVKRVVITSSFAAILDPTKGVRPGYTYTESDWNPVTYEQAQDGDGGTAYCASKTFAERAAYDFVKEKKPNFDVASICPPMIYGPLEHAASLDKLNTSSADIYRFIDGSSKEPGETQFPAFVDVRDVGEAHVKAYESSAGAGRFFTTGGNFQYIDVCRIIREALPELKDKVPEPGKTEYVETFKVDNSKAKRELGLQFTPLEVTIRDTARSLARLQETKA